MGKLLDASIKKAAQMVAKMSATGHVNKGECIKLFELQVEKFTQQYEQTSARH